MEDFFWFVGLFEGEGCIAIDKNDRNRPSLEISMQDRDIMERVSKLLDHNIRSRTPNGRNVKGEPFKEIHKVRIAGHKAKKVIQAIYPYMSKRRQEKMREALEAWKPKTTYKTEGYTPKPRKEINIPLLKNTI